MTLDGIPLREGEKEKYFENHSLSWWRQKTVTKHKEEDGVEALDSKELTQMLFDDFENHFGWPERLRGKDMHPDGIVALCGAVVKAVTDDIVDARVCELNDWCNLRGTSVSPKHMTDIRETAERTLRRKDFSIYLFGIAPDSLIREADRVAQQIYDEYYQGQERKISAYIRKSGITIKELVQALRDRGIFNDEIPDWITHCTPQRELTLKILIKRLKERKEANDGR